MKIKALVEIDLDAEDYRARLRDDVAKPTDAEIAALALQYISGSGVGPFDAKVTAKAVTSPRLELVITRDPDGGDEIDIYVDGVPVAQTDIEVRTFHIDAGAGYSWDDWVDSRADDVAQASEPVARMLTELALDPPGEQYIEDMPDDEDERELEFDRALRGYQRLYAKQSACAHYGSWGGYGARYVCEDCGKALPIPPHAFQQRVDVPHSYCNLCHYSEETGNHE